MSSSPEKVSKINRGVNSVRVMRIQMDLHSGPPNSAPALHKCSSMYLKSNSLSISLLKSSFRASSNDESWTQMRKHNFLIGYQEYIID